MPAVQPLRAIRALAALSRDPDDTAQVFTIIDALSGDTPERNLRRFAAHPDGARLLRERPEIVPVLSDQDALRALPAGSLGRAYLAFVQGESITADGLVEAAEDGSLDIREQGSDLDWLARRIRDTHDLWHNVTGFRGDVLGEASLLAFSHAQLPNAGVLLIVMTALARLHDVAATKLILGAMRTGASAEWLPVVDWESMLHLPLDEVRARLRITPAPDYAPLRTRELRAQGMLPARGLARAA